MPGADGTGRRPPITASVAQEGADRRSPSNTEPPSHPEGVAASRLFAGRSQGALSLPEQIAAELGERILNEQIAPGSRIGEEKVAREFGVSRGPIRDALKMLEQAGLVRIASRKGTVATPLTQDDYREIFVLRSGLSEIVVRGFADHATPENLAHFRLHLDATERLADDERQVLARQRPRLHQLLQPPVRLGRARDHEQPRGVAVEPVDDPRAFRVVPTLDVVREQPVDERAPRVARRGMDDEPRRLVDDEQVLVLVGHDQLDRLRDEPARPRRGRLELQLLPAVQAVALRARASVDELGKRGQKTKGVPFVGKVNVVVRTPRGLESASEPRSPSGPAGY